MAWMRLRIGAAQRGGKIDQLADRHFQRRRQLRHEADAAQHFGTVAARIEAVDGDLAIMRVFAEQAADQGGFAGPVGADQGDTFAESDIEADAIEDTGAAECLGDVVELDHGRDYREAAAVDIEFRSKIRKVFCLARPAIGQAGPAQSSFDSPLTS